MPNRAYQNIKKVIEFYPELESLQQNNNLSADSSKPFIVHSKKSLRLYIFSRALKRKRKMVEISSINYNSQKKVRTFESQCILIKKYSSTHQYRTGKKPNSNIRPEIYVDRRLLCWYRIHNIRQFELVFNDLMDH
jgi:hypothetical protein